MWIRSDGVSASAGAVRVSVGATTTFIYDTSFLAWSRFDLLLSTRPKFRWQRCKTPTSQEHVVDPGSILVTRLIRFRDENHIHDENDFRPIKLQFIIPIYGTWYTNRYIKQQHNQRTNNPNFIFRGLELYIL